MYACLCTCACTCASRTSKHELILRCIHMCIDRCGSASTAPSMHSLTRFTHSTEARTHMVVSQRRVCHYVAFFGNSSFPALQMYSQKNKNRGMLTKLVSQLNLALHSCFFSLRSMMTEHRLHLPICVCRDPKACFAGAVPMTTPRIRPSH